MPRKKKVKNQKGKGVYRNVVNKLFNADLKPSENHPPMWTKDGIKFAKFLGPGSVFDPKKKPVSAVDATARMHDMLYAKAKTPADVKAADLRMLKKLDDIQKKGEDNAFNINLGRIPMKAKVLAEKIGILKPGSFSSMSGTNEYDEEIDKMTQQGFGKGKGKKKPNVWMSHVKQVRSKNKGMKYSDVLKLASKSYKK